MAASKGPRPMKLLSSPFYSNNNNKSHLYNILATLASINFFTVSCLSSLSIPKFVSSFMTFSTDFYLTQWAQYFDDLDMVPIRISYHPVLK